ncbi:MAG: ATP-dependent helicase [Clostridia bacterium]|nr:ATP-dependent helicase [Clostridia bacterium]
MKCILPENWIPSDGIQLEDAAEKAVRNPGNVCVVAGPGAGKTELLAQKASYLFTTNKCATPRKILAICFKNDAADNLKKRVVGRCGREVERRFISLTYDAFAKSIVDHFRMALPKELRPNADYAVKEDEIIKAAFIKAGYKNTLGLSPRDLKNHFNNELGQVQLPLVGESIRNKAWKLLTDGFDKYGSCLSFKMISILAEYIVRTNPQIKKAIQITYSHVFLDEFQDTTKLQYALVACCFLNSHSILTAVGDNKQRIMLWAGALRTAFNDFHRDFNAEGLRLVMNHRSAPRLVALQKAMYASLNDAEGDVQISDKWEPDEGEIKLYIADDEILEANAIANEIKGKVESGIQPNDICILCKQLPKNYTQKLIETLANYGIRARVEDEYQNLIKEPVVELIIAFISLAINKKRPQEWEFVSNAMEELHGINMNDSSVAYQNLQTQLVQIFNELSDSMQITDLVESIKNVLNKIIGFIGKGHLIAFYPSYSQNAYLDDCIRRFSEFFYEELLLVECNWDQAIDNFMGKNSIPIMTIHKSKGLEYSDVYFIGLEDSAFWNFKNQPEEDRCAFFVALSRAKTSVAFSFCNLRSSLKYPTQRHNEVNEFFDLLQSPNMAEVITLKYKI